MKRLLFGAMFFFLFSCSVMKYEEVAIFYNTNKIEITSLIDAIEMSGLNFSILSESMGSGYIVGIYNKYRRTHEFRILKNEIENIEFHTENNITVSYAKLLSRCLDFLKKHHLRSFQSTEFGESAIRTGYKIGFNSIIYIIYFPDENAKNNFDIARGDILKRIDGKFWYYRYTRADGFFF